ncbi:hypothetical protein QTP70_019636, partial [Hemibagrus guttatus]
DRVPREELWYCMRKSRVAEKYVRVVQDMYERSRTVVRCAVGQTEEFKVEVGLHQGSALSPFLFAIVMDQLSEEVRQESPWTMMFADDIVVCSKSREQVEESLERWRFALERRGMKVSRSKTEYMCVNEKEGSGTVRLQGEEVKKVQEFKYLESTVQSNGESGKKVKKPVQAGWNGWRKVSGVLCDRKISVRIKGKVYRTVVRPAMLYGLETVSLRKRQESELEVAELKMLSFSLGVTRLDRIRNEYIRGTAHVGRLRGKVREARLRWFGHVQMRESEYIGRRMLDMELPGRRQRGRPKRRYMDGINEDMKLRDVTPLDFAPPPQPLVGLSAKMASIMEGPLSKWTNLMKGWQYRWFVLDYNAGLLSYYTSKDKMMRGSRRGCVRLRGAVIGIDDEDDSTFTITVDQKTFHFQARDADEREKWIHALEGTILRHALQLREAETAFVPSVQDFDKKLAEADAYLQILIDQLKLFDEKIKDCKDDESRRKIENLKETTCSMVESIKHCIVLLQIAKSTINPVDGVHQPSPLDASVVSAVAMPTQTTLPTDGAQVCKAEQRPSSLPMGPVVTVMGSLQTPTPNSTGSGPSAPSSSVTTPSHMNMPANAVPDFSYSSSEDEFYDADEFYQSSASPKHCIDPSRTPGVNSEGNAALKRPNTTESLNSSMSNGTTDADQYDSHDERDDDGEGESVEEHKSVIMHLLSQVRLGMDLTKVVLPTFILERRSLLEMYADFFAHPDLFVSIAEQAEPRERMVQVVRWYLSAFHAGRKGSVAKKPYNPILGEVFYCHWDLPSETEEPAPGEPVSEGPVPHCSRGSVSFVAEQVSHHPPISAFYAECISKKIQFNAHIWTKSKFLGMSIGVHNIGQGCVSCLEHDEHYILTFPNGYGRSILTVPWVELGGECNISCSKTGYSANIVFHTKPFYGGKKHRITADIFGPNDKKSFCSIEGEWNGVMYAKWASGENSVFIDTRKLSIIKKKVRKLEDQLEYESRQLWKDVTLNLKLKDIDAATDAKHRLEEKQRAEARERKEQEIQWETRLFHEDGECWVYDEPLLKRVASLRH